MAGKEAIKKIARNGAKESAKESGGKINKIAQGKQNKHISGTNEYKTATSREKKGLIEVDSKFLEETVKNKGTGQHKEILDFGKPIGKYLIEILAIIH